MYFNVKESTLIINENKLDMERVYESGGISFDYETNPFRYDFKEAYVDESGKLLTRNITLESLNFKFELEIKDDSKYYPFLMELAKSQFNKDTGDFINIIFETGYFRIESNKAYFKYPPTPPDYTYKGVVFNFDFVNNSIKYNVKKKWWV